MKGVMEKQKDRPKKVIIENTNACNAHCVFCAHDSLTRKIGFMDFSLFRKIIDNCANLKVKEVAIYRLGEPLLDPDFSEKVAYAKKAGIELVSTNTNASLLTEETAIKVLDSGLDVIYISLDGNSKEVYEKIRKGLDYNVVEKNIRRFIELRNSRNREKPAIVFSFCCIDENKHQVKDFIRTWNGHGQIWISNIHNWSGKAKVKTKNSVSIKRTDPCRILWTELIVSWDGKVPLCCIDYDDKLIMGDLKNESISDVWGGEKYKKNRKIHMDGDFNKIPLCESCTWYFSWWMRDWAE
jgi:radical SAM protein with 4Fe4S-binding SPASM domain